MVRNGVKFFRLDFKVHYLIYFSTIKRKTSEKLLLVTCIFVQPENCAEKDGLFACVINVFHTVESFRLPFYFKKLNNYPVQLLRYVSYVSESLFWGVYSMLSPV